MALLQKLSTKFGVEYENAYSKIINIQLDTLNSNVHMRVGTYVNKEARDTAKEPIDIKIYNVNNRSAVNTDYDNYFNCSNADNANKDENILKQGYAYLKSLSSYSDALDV